MNFGLVAKEIKEFSKDKVITLLDVGGVSLIKNESKN